MPVAFDLWCVCPHNAGHENSFCNRMKILVLLAFRLYSLPVFPVDVASRISDREIIESLAELKAGQRSPQEKIDQRLTAMQEQTDQRFAAVDQRFVSIDQRFEFLQQLMLVMIAGIFGLIGFIVWDRYTTPRPMVRALSALSMRCASLPRRIKSWKPFCAVSRCCSTLAGRWNKSLLIAAGIAQQSRTTAEPESRITAARLTNQCFFVTYV